MVTCWTNKSNFMYVTGVAALCTCWSKESGL